MRLVFAILIVISAFKSFEVQAQANAAETAVVFDPLFWKDELKLSAGQYDEIRTINEEYYQEIFRIVNEHEGNTSALRSATTELLQKRSERIWRTFHSKQKKKWKKLSTEYALDRQSTYSAAPAKRKDGTRA